MAMHLVTGGSGFLGSHVVRRLRAEGEGVRVLDVIDSPDRPPGTEFVACDIRDRRGVRDAMKGVRFVHHNVALVPLAKAGPEFRDVNVDGTRIAANAALDARVRLFVHMSSSAVFGIPGACPITGDTPPAPVEAYGRAKLAAEQEVQAAGRKGLPSLILRPRTILGPGRLGIFQILFEWIRDNRNIYVVGNGDNPFQFVHVDDLVTAALLGAENERQGVFNIGADRYSTLREDLHTTIRHAGSTSRVVGLPVGLTVPVLKVLDALRICPLAPWHYLTYHKPFFFDLSDAIKQLGWRPRHSNVETMIQAYDWYIEHESQAGRAGARSIHRDPVKQGVLRLLKWLS